MGCDIHCFAERKTPTGWRQITRLADYSNEISDRLWTGRNYDLFSTLAGVRGQNDPIVWPRGLPDDVSKGVLRHFTWDDHDPTWYTVKELIVAAKDRKDDDAFMAFLCHVVPQLLAYSDSGQGDDVRVVMFFDS